MNIHMIMILVGLLFVAVIFASINEDVQKKKSANMSFVAGLSKVLSDIAVGLIITAIPTAILLNYLKPHPEDVMPVFISSGTYAEMLDDATPEAIDEMVDDCTAALLHAQEPNLYFDRASLYFETSNLDLAYSDLQKCIELEEHWIYYYDLGVVAGYRLDYKMALEHFETALSMEIPVSERGLVLNTKEMIENYYGTWLSSLIL